jgi:FkbM family methyltransferase
MISKIFRMLPKFAGKIRIGKIIFKKAINNLKDIDIKLSNGLFFRIPNLKENIGFDLFIDGAYEELYVDYFVKTIPINGVFVDVGANIGCISIPLAFRRPDLTIIAIEASTKVYKYLKHNVEINKLKNILILNKAVSKKDDLLLSFSSPEDYFGKGSFSENFVDFNETVSTITLDTLKSKLNLERIDLIKVDVEGYEKDVFIGGELTLNQPNAPIILFEFVDWAEDQANGFKAGDAQRILEKYGFELFQFDKPKQIIKISNIIEKGNGMILAKKNNSI